MKFKKCLSLTVLLLASSVSCLNAIDSAKANALLDEIATISLIDSRVRLSHEWDPFKYAQDEVTNRFNQDGTLKVYPSAYANNENHYDAYKKYEQLMFELSSMIPDNYEQDIFYLNSNPKNKLLIRVASDLKNKKYQRILEFYNNPERKLPWIRNPNRDEADRVAKELNSSGYLHAWAYYLYAPEVPEIYQINENMRGNISSAISGLDNGEFYPFVIRRLNKDLAICKSKPPGWEQNQRNLKDTLLAYLIRYPSKETLAYLLRINHCVSEQTEYVKSPFEVPMPEAKAVKIDLSKCRNFGAEFAKALKSKRSEQRQAWETLFESVEDDADFAEFLKGYRSVL